MVYKNKSLIIQKKYISNYLKKWMNKIISIKIKEKNLAKQSIIFNVLFYWKETLQSESN